MQRDDVEFESQGLICRAWHYRPEAGSPVPIIVMAHGLNGTREMRLDAFAERFAQVGYAVLAFDYRYFGASEGTPRQLLTAGRQRDDWRAALSFARTLPGVDARRVVAWGTSFSGGHVMVLGAEALNLSAVIAMNPFTDGLASSLTVSPRSLLPLAWRAVVDVLRAPLGREPIYVHNYGRPGEPAMMTVPDAVPGCERLVESATEHPVPNRISVRLALQIGLLRPGTKLRHLRCPGMVNICNLDSVAPAAATLRHARRNPKLWVTRHDCGHYAIYFDQPFETVVAEQIAFLRSVFDSST